MKRTSSLLLYILIALHVLAMAAYAEPVNLVDNPTADRGYDAWERPNFTIFRQNDGNSAFQLSTYINKSTGSSYHSTMRQKAQINESTAGKYAVFAAYINKSENGDFTSAPRPVLYADAFDTNGKSNYKNSMRMWMENLQEWREGWGWKPVWIIKRMESDFAKIEIRISHEGGSNPLNQESYASSLLDDIELRIFESREEAEKFVISYVKSHAETATKPTGRTVFPKELDHGAPAHNSVLAKVSYERVSGLFTYVYYVSVDPKLERGIKAIMVDATSVNESGVPETTPAAKGDDMLINDFTLGGYRWGRAFSNTPEGTSRYCVQKVPLGVLSPAESWGCSIRCNGYVACSAKYSNKTAPDGTIIRSYAEEAGPGENVQLMIVYSRGFPTFRHSVLVPSNNGFTDLILDNVRNAGKYETPFSIEEATLNEIDSTATLSRATIGPSRPMQTKTLASSQITFTILSTTPRCGGGYMMLRKYTPSRPCLNRQCSPLIEATLIMVSVFLTKS